MWFSFQTCCILTLSFSFGLLLLSPFRCLMSSYASYTSDRSSFRRFARATLAPASA
jgi:hypothetical protein